VDSKLSLGSYLRVVEIYHLWSLQLMENSVSSNIPQETFRLAAKSDIAIEKRSAELSEVAQAKYSIAEYCSHFNSIELNE
jgi:hypothetical protein